MTLITNPHDRPQTDGTNSSPAGQPQLDERLTRSERFESIGRLAGGIAHDFNNLLTAILGYTEILLSDRAETDPDRADIEEIQKAGKRAAVLTQQLLAFSRRQVLMPEVVDLNRTVVDMQNIAGRLVREDMVLTCHVAAEPAMVKVDPAQIEQVIVNLVLCARDGLSMDGRIAIEVARVAGADAELPSELRATGSEYVRLTVGDNGTAIPAEALAHLFEPFFAAKELGRGTGLGLASAYGIVQQSGGFITVESQGGKGTTFRIYFPAVPAAAVDSAGSARTSESVGGNEMILLVEDEDAVRAIVMAVLSRQGYRVLEAATPQVACALFDIHGAEIDMLLTDVVMPGMNGPVLAQQLVGRRPELKVLFMSGYADLSVTLDPGNPNISFLGKPFQASVLSARVREMLNRPGRAPHHP